MSNKEKAFTYYTENNEPTGMTEKPCGFICDADEGKEALIESLIRALNDVAFKPILNEPETWRDWICI